MNETKYTKHNFQSGNKLYASQLNEMDEQIALNEENINQLSDEIDNKQPKGDYALKSEIPTSLPASDVYEWAKKPNKPSYTASEVGALPSDTKIPTKTSDLTNDSGFLTEHQDLSDYAKKNEIPTIPVQSVNGKTGAVQLSAADVGARASTWMPTASDIGALPIDTNIPTKTSEITNDSGFIDRTISDLVNYYKKSETLSASEINNKISAIPKFAISVVSSLPTSDISDTTVYLVGGGTGSDLYTEYIFIIEANSPTNGDGKYDETSGTWEVLGSQRVDLTGYAKQSDLLQLSEAIADLEERDVDLTGYATEEYVDAEIADLEIRASQQNVLFAEGETMEEAAEWLAENGVVTNAYVMPNNFFWKYMLTETVVENTGSGYTNALDGVTKNINQRWSHSGKKLSAADGYLTVTIPVTADQKVYVNLPRSAFLGNYPRIHYLDASNNYVTTLDRLAANAQVLTTVDGITSWTTGYEYSVAGDASSNARLANADNITQMVLVLNVYDPSIGKETGSSSTLGAVSETDDVVKNLIVSIGNPIEEGGGTTTVKEYKWTSTGRSFVPTEYDDDIANLVKVTTAHTEQILELQENGVGGVVKETEKEAYDRIKSWKYPIHEDAPVFLLETNKPAIPSTDWNTEAIYAKYDELMAVNSQYITRVNCGMASDNTTPIYVYHFKEPEPHYNGTWSETKPVILVVSGVHPSEQSGVWSMYYAMEEITNNKKLLDIRRNLHIIVMPMINPTGSTDSEYGVRNPDGIQVHYNFEVDFKYPTDSGYVAHGNRNHGGETPLSIPETQYFAEIMEEHKDTLACVLSCHNNDVDTQYGTGFVWSSCATHFMCNLGFRLADKLSAAWREKHGTAFDEGVRWANEYALTKKAEGSSLFPSAKEQEEWDFRVGRSGISGSGGTEYKQALKYGVHGINVEVCDRCMILDRDFSKKRTANVTTMGAETYINFFRTFMAVYNPLAKNEYAPNLPWKD